jgi:hypothetical protein
MARYAGVVLARVDPVEPVISGPEATVHSHRLGAVARVADALELDHAEAPAWLDGEGVGVVVHG